MVTGVLVTIMLDGAIAVDELLLASTAAMLCAAGVRGKRRLRRASGAFSDASRGRYALMHDKLCKITTSSMRTVALWVACEELASSASVETSESGRAAMAVGSEDYTSFAVVSFRPLKL